MVNGDGLSCMAASFHSCHVLIFSILVSFPVHNLPVDLHMHAPPRAVKAYVVSLVPPSRGFFISRHLFHSSVLFLLFLLFVAGRFATWQPRTHSTIFRSANATAMQQWFRFQTAKWKVTAVKLCLLAWRSKLLLRWNSAWATWFPCLPSLLKRYMFQLSIQWGNGSSQILPVKGAGSRNEAGEAWCANYRSSWKLPGMAQNYGINEGKLAHAENNPQVLRPIL